jgi:hypothetical protein
VEKEELVAKGEISGKRKRRINGKRGISGKRERKIGGKKGISGKREEYCTCSRKREGELVEKGGLVEKR